MDIINDYFLIKQVDQLIRQRRTGTPRELGEQLEMSERQARRIIDYMRSLDMPIEYCKHDKTYYYPNKISIIFEISVEEKGKMKKVFGGAKNNFINFENILHADNFCRTLHLVL